MRTASEGISENGDPVNTGNMRRKRDNAMQSKKNAHRDIIDQSPFSSATARIIAAGAGTALIFAGTMTTPHVAFADEGTGSEGQGNEVFVPHEGDGIIDTANEGEDAYNDAVANEGQAYDAYNNAAAEESQAQEAYDDASQDLNDANAEVTGVENGAEQAVQGIQDEAAKDAQTASGEREQAEESLQEAEQDEAIAQQDKNDADQAVNDAQDDLEKAEQEAQAHNASEENLADAQRANEAAQADLAQKQNDLDQANQDVTDAQNAVTDAQSTKDTADQAVTDAQSAVNDAQSVADSAQSDLDQTQAAYDAAQALANASAQELEQQLNAAQDAYNDAEQAVEDAERANQEAQDALAQAQQAEATAKSNWEAKDAASQQADQTASQAEQAKNVAETDKSTAKSALDAANAILAEKQEAQRKAQAALEDAQQAQASAASVLAEKQAAYDAAKKVYDDFLAGGTVAFFDEMGSTTASGYLTDTTSKEGPVTTGNNQRPATTFASHTEIGGEYDATSLQNIYYAIQWLKYCNQIRTEFNLPALLVTDELMASAERNANFSTYYYDHARTANGVTLNMADYHGGRGAENLYVSGIGMEAAYNGWFYEEKALWESLVAQDPNVAQYWLNLTGLSNYLGYTPNIGHYFNFVNPAYVYTGLGLNYMPWNQLAPGTPGEVQGAAVQHFRSQVETTAYTVEEYEQRLLAYWNEAIGKINSAITALNDATSAKQAADQQVSTKANALAVVNIDLQSAQSDVTTKQTDYDNAVTRLNTATATYDSAFSDAATKKTEANNAKTIYEQAQATTQAATQTANEKQTAYDNAVSARNTALATLNAAQSALDGEDPDLVARKQERDAAQTAYDQAVANLTTAQTALQEAQNAYNAAQTALTTARGVLAEKQQAQTTAQNAVNGAQQTANATQTAYDEQARYVGALKAAQTKLANAQTAADDAATALANAQQATQAARDSLQDKTDAETAAKAKLARANALTATDALAGSITDIDFARLNSYKQELEEAQAKVTAAQATFDAASDALDAAAAKTRNAYSAYLEAVAARAFAQTEFERLVKQEEEQVSEGLLLNLDAAGGTFQGAPQVRRIGRNLYAIDLLPVPTMPGHVFQGWFTEDGTLVAGPDGTSTVLVRRTDPQPDTTLRLRALPLAATLDATGNGDGGADASEGGIDDKTNLVAHWEERKVTDATVDAPTYAQDGGNPTSSWMGQYASDAPELTAPAGKAKTATPATGTQAKPSSLELTPATYATATADGTTGAGMTAGADANSAEAATLIASKATSELAQTGDAVASTGILAAMAALLGAGSLISGLFITPKDDKE